MNPKDFSKARAEDLLLGKLASQYGAAPKEQVSTSLKKQKMVWEQEHRLVRLVDLLEQGGKLDKKKWEEVEKRFRQNFKICDNCFTTFNIENFPEGKKFKCKKCGAILTVERSTSKEEALTFEQVQEYLCIDQKELGLMISSGELKGFLDGNVMKFRKSDVERVKKLKESQPTMILDPSSASSPLSSPLPRTSPPSSPSPPTPSSTLAPSVSSKMTMKEVLSTLQINESQLRKMMALGELIPTYEGDQMLFPREQVMRIKEMRQSQPTMILTDMRVDKSLEGEQLVSFEEAMEDLGVDSLTLQSLIQQAGIHPIGRGDKEFFRTSDIARLRSQLREKALFPSPSPSPSPSSSPSPPPTPSSKATFSLFEILSTPGQKKTIEDREVYEIQFQQKSFWLLSFSDLSELFLIERSGFLPEKNFSTALVAYKGEWQIKRTGKIGNQWVLLGEEGIPPELLKLSEVQVLGYLVARITSP